MTRSLITRCCLVGSCALALAALNSARAEAEPPPWPTNAWPTAAPAEQGLDETRLGELVTTIRDDATGPYRDVHSLLIVRGGFLVLEEYFDGHDADDRHTLQSVSKSFTSALVGIAIENGQIASVDELVLGFFDEDDLEGIDSIDDRKRAMTLEDLLTMRSGTDYHERGPDSPHFQLNRKKTGWTEFILSRPMVHEPGVHFQYDSGAVILTSALIKQRTGAHADVYAAEHLFKPLNITDIEWFSNAEDHPHTGGGLHLRPRDMAKFGLLYLRDGVWAGEQVVPKSWVEESQKMHVTFDRQRGGSKGYGYWWWIFPPDPEGGGEQDIYAALGYMGQHIFVIPEHDMVVVVTGGARHGEGQNVASRFLYSHILPAVVAQLDK